MTITDSQLLVYFRAYEDRGCSLSQETGSQQEEHQLVQGAL